MAIPAYMWLKDDGGADIKGSVTVRPPILPRELLVRSTHGQLPLGIRLGYSDEDGVTADFEAPLGQAV